MLSTVLLLGSLAWAEITVLPSVKNTAPVSYPVEALEQALGGEVLLQLTIDSDGRVVESTVIESSDPIFNEAAKLTLGQYVFTPALDENAAPIVSQIQYRFVFTPEILPSVSIRGRVKEAGFRDPLQGVIVTAINKEGQQVVTTTEKDGAFQFLGLAPGDWVVEASKSGLISKTQALKIEEGKLQELTFSLIRDQAETALKADDTIIVEAERETSEVTVKTLSSEQIEVLPGSNGDVVKAIQNLPGIARAPSGIGQLIIRGTAPEDSSFFIDGSPIPDVFHFAGLTTVVSPSNIEAVQYLSGNYSVRYGRQLGGLVDIQTRTKFPDREASFVSVDLYQSAAYLEKMIGDDVVVAVSGRRSYADVILNPIFQSLGASFRTPRYYDFQTQATVRTKSGGLIQGLFFLSDDAFSFSQASGEDDEQVNAAYAKDFQKFQLKYTQPFADSWQSQLVIGGGPQRQDFLFDLNGEAYERQNELNVRQEFARGLKEETGSAVRFGLDVNSGIFSYLYDLPSFPYEREEAELWYLEPAVYGEYRYRGKYADVIGGLRWDNYFLEDAEQQQAIDPRISSRFFLTDSLRFIASTGLTSQAPLPRERSEANEGDPSLLPERSWQNSFGLQQELLAGALRWQLIGYYNELYDLVVGREDRFQFFTGPPPIGPFDTEDYANEGTGMVCGTELEIRYVDPVRFGLLAATFGHSERTDREGNTRLFTYDQPIIINALYSQLLPKNWRLGTRIRFGSGNPYTPVANRIYDLNEREFIPVYSDEEDRLAPFFSMDIRIDKEYVFTNWKLDTYLDIQNATSYPNVEIMSWTYDYAEEQPLQGTPIFPVFGLKGEW